jgi:phosphoserine aminotransferase
MSRVYNFSAGPAALPLAVLERARDELTDYAGSGMSVMELSHRGPAFRDIAARSEQLLRDLLRIPDHYRVLFLQGGATLQFAMAPLNLAAADARVDYVVSGSWGRKAVAEAKRLCRVRIAADGVDSGYTRVPPREGWDTSADAAYLHYTPNETIGGVEFHWVPDTAPVPLVADMSSNILSRPLDVGRFGLIYAGAQKNIGPAGLTLVIIRDDLLSCAREDVPGMLRYEVHAEAGSMSNTPPTFAWYMAGLVFEWLRDQGGLETVGARNDRKAATLYGAIDESDFYANPVETGSRSRMNVPFTLAEPSLDDAFLREAEATGLANLKGHRSVGGMRASLYNAMPQAGVDALVEFMREFERTRA